MSLTFSDHNPLGVNTLQVLCVWNQNHINYKLVNLSQSLVRLVLKYKLGGGGGPNCRVGIDYNIHHFGHATTAQNVTLGVGRQDTRGHEMGHSLGEG